jgi:DnaJ family protein A protein 2
MGGMGGARRQASVDNDEYYETLGVKKDCSISDIKKAYKKLAMKHHPDRGGDEEKFKTITTAYEVLSDEEQKEKYDRYGKDGGGGRGGGGGGDVFSQFFGGGGGGGGGRRGKQKGQPMVHPIEATLEDLYNGKVMKLAVTRQVLENPDEEPKPCRECNGQGVVIRVRQLGPGMLQQMQTICGDCGGEGYNVKMKKERKVLEVGIDKGMKHGSKIKFAGEANHKPGMLPGDVVFVVAQKPHAVFKRKGMHLIIQKEVTLKEALCGTSFVVKHLDGREIACTTAAGDIIEPDSFKVIEGEGMPMHENPFVKGKLVIQFVVKFPTAGQLDKKALESLSELLPSPPAAPKIGEDVEECKLEHFDFEMLKQDYQQNKSAYDSDEDEESGGRSVQCAQG